MKPFIPAILWAIIIFTMSVGPSIQLPDAVFSPDKIGHLVAYGVLTWLTLKALKKSKKISPTTANLTVLAVSIYGVVLEIVQWAFFPNRFFEVWDMVANCAGATLSYLAFTFYFIKT